MVVIYCYLERGNYKVLKFHVNVSFTLKEAPLSFKRRPPISTTHLSPEIKNYWWCLLEEIKVNISIAPIKLIVLSKQSQ